MRQSPCAVRARRGETPPNSPNPSPQEIPMNTSTSLQALAALAVGSALLASATPADAARGGFRSAPVQVTRAPAPTFAPRSNARSLIGDLGKIGSAAVNEVKTVGGDIAAGKVQNIPGEVLKTGSKVAGAVVK